MSQLYKDLYEGSAKDGPENRIKSFLNLTSISELGPIQMLNTLRNYWEHKATQIDASKKQKAMAAMSELSQRKVAAITELDKSDWQKSACALINGFNSLVLQPLRDSITTR